MNDIGNEGSWCTENSIQHSDLKKINFKKMKMQNGEEKVASHREKDRLTGNHGMLRAWDGMSPHADVQKANTWTLSPSSRRPSQSRLGSRMCGMETQHSSGASRWKDSAGTSSRRARK